jgi:hypothetical protein
MFDTMSAAYLIREINYLIDDNFSVKNGHEMIGLFSFKHSDLNSSAVQEFIVQLDGF